MILTKPARTFSTRSHTPGLAHVAMFVAEKVTLFGSEFCHFCEALITCVGFYFSLRHEPPNSIHLETFNAITVRQELFHCQSSIIEVQKVY